jgi:hypothetical protein
VLALLLPGAVWAAECAQFLLQVEHPDGSPARGLQVEVQAGGPAGVRIDTKVVSPSGSLLIQLTATSGTMVDVRVSQPGIKLLYPPRARLAITCEGSAPVVVCRSGQDCQLSGADQVSAMLAKAESRIRNMTSEQMMAFFEEWKAHASEVGRETQAPNAQLIEALVKRERRIEAASEASSLLKRFANRSREILDRFVRHAPKALDHPSPMPFEQMNEASKAYNPVFDELSEQADAYRKKTSDYWSSEVSAEFQALVDRALAIHQLYIRPLNTELTLINDCVRKQPGCPGAAAARAQVTQAVEKTRAEAIPALDEFEKDTKDWLQTLNERLLSDRTARSDTEPGPADKGERR